jgi:hypothetical protein
MEEKQYDWAAFLRLRDSGRCERLGCFEIAKWPEHMGGGWHRSAECRSCRSHDRAKQLTPVFSRAYSGPATLFNPIHQIKYENFAPPLP